MKQNLNSELLLFKIEEQFFALEATCIKEIIESQEFFDIPLECQHIKKILVYRDNAIGVLNTEYYFSKKTSKDNFFIILENLTAIPVDELGGILNSSLFERGKNTLKERFIKSVFYTNEQPILLIDYEELKSHEGKTLIIPI